MNRKLATFAALVGLTLAGCTSQEVRTDGDFSIKWEGPLQGYMHTRDVLPDYQDEVLDIGTLASAQRDGELISFDFAPLFFADIGPIFGAGIGLAGARVNILWLDIGLGTGFYDPRPDTGAK